MDWAKLRRADWMVLGGGVVLIIGLFTFTWYSDDGFTAAATSSPYAIWGILALIVTIVIVLDYALALFSPQTQVPTTKYGRDLTRVGACALLLLLLLIKFLAHVGSFGWGFFVDVILAAVVTAGAWALVQRASQAG
jgi:uncharacterized membrane protein YhaH (DUF805 family)